MCFLLYPDFVKTQENVIVCNQGTPSHPGRGLLHLGAYFPPPHLIVCARHFW
jgi:hypothetical protein